MKPSSRSCTPTTRTRRSIHFQRTTGTQAREASRVAPHLSNAFAKKNPNTLLIDAGDVLQGTPYFNYYRGEVEYKAMSAIGYDASTLGNHEFDNAIEALAAALKFANFDIVSTNYDGKGTALEGRVKPYVVKTVGGIRVGLFGLGISPTALITPENFKGVTYNDPVIAARNVVKTLKT